MQLVALPRRSLQQIETLAAPLEGLNEGRGITKLKSDESVRLSNFVPRSDGLYARAGTRKWVSGLNGAVESIVTWGDRRMFAATGSALYEIRQNVAIPSGNGFMSGRWSGDTISNPAGQFLVVSNGMDGIRVFNGSSWTSPGISGVDSTLLAGPIWHQRRVFAYEKGTLNVWYLEASAFGGVASPLPIGALCQRGGEIVALASLDRDKAKNREDMLVILTSNGEVIIFNGSNPALAESWSLQGVYQGPLPVGWRPFGKIGGDLVMLTVDGMITVPGTLAKPNSQQPDATLTDRVSATYAVDAHYRLKAGWQVVDSDADDGLVIINRPGGEQLANAEKAWTELRGMPATAWGMTLDGTFFGTASGEIKRYGIGHDDDGVGIEALAVSAYWRPGRNRLATVRRLRPLMRSVPIKPHLAVITDYAQPAASYPAPEAVGGSTWDFPWQGDNRPWQSPLEKTTWDWRMASGKGHAIATVFSVKTRAPLVYNGMDVMMEIGGPT